MAPARSASRRSSLAPVEALRKLTSAACLSGWIDQHGVATDLTVGQTCPPEYQQLGQDRVEQTVRHLVGRSVGQPVPLGEQADEQGVIRRAGPARSHDLGHGSPDLTRPHREVGLAFHLLQAGEGEGGPRVAVEQKTAGLRKELGIGRIAAVHGDGESGR